MKFPDSSGCRDVELVSICHCRFSCEKAKQSEEAESEYLHRGVSDLAYITVRIILSARIFYFITEYRPECVQFLSGTQRYRRKVRREDPCKAMPQLCSVFSHVFRTFCLRFLFAEKARFPVNCTFFIFIKIKRKEQAFLNLFLTKRRRTK